jgi:ABC-type bacteriocin/lantibiotic exporter with double-glycine peptidase domain
MIHRRFLIPEVVQTSTIDCGPACLSALLGGFGIHASYGRLREACQTGIDGTSIDTLEDLAVRLGLKAEQIVLPPGHILFAEAAALPAITVIKLPNGFTHFVVVWRQHGSRLQVMDPATGRRWPTFAQFAKDLYIHEISVPAAGWREWAQSDEFLGTLKARAGELGLTPSESSELVGTALADRGWRSLAMVDAAVRMLRALDRQGAFGDRRRISHLLRVTVGRAMEAPENTYRLIPPEYWTVRQLSDDELAVRGAVLVRVKGRSETPVDLTSLPLEVAAAITERPPRPAAELWRLLKQDGAFAPAMVTAALLVSAAGTVLQTLLFKALISGASQLSGQGQRLGAVLAVLILLLVLLALEIPAIATLVGMGRRLEARFRRAFLMKLPRIADHYFNSRLISDMAERSHSVHNIRALPALAGQLLLSGFQLLATAAAVVWIDPALWPLALLSVTVAVGLPLAVQPVLGERELRVRTHSGALSRFYLDALLGLIPIRTHVADGVVRGEHRNLLARWSASSLATEKVAVALEGFQLAVGYGLAALLTIVHISLHPDSSATLLVAYWGLNIPAIGRDLAARAATYPLYRSVVLRLMEPLCALETAVGTQAVERTPSSVAPADPPAARHARGAAIAMRGVSAMAGGHAVLHDITLDIPAGSHVAVVGPSGAGKSSLAGLLLGWPIPASGELSVDDAALSAATLERLRRQTAWIDPTVHLWNRSLIENLRFGSYGELAMPLGEGVEEADLSSVLERLPDGLQTPLGDGGVLVSGGEGQRVRVGRALLRPGIRLVIMDEPFRGLDAGARKELLRRARQTWRDRTMLFITHDVADTQTFDRVLVMEGGRIVEDGAPAELGKLAGSRYSALLYREAALKRQLLQSGVWRRLHMVNGSLVEESYQPRVSDSRELMNAG